MEASAVKIYYINKINLFSRRLLYPDPQLHLLFSVLFKDSKSIFHISSLFTSHRLNISLLISLIIQNYLLKSIPEVNL